MHAAACLVPRWRRRQSGSALAKAPACSHWQGRLHVLQPKNWFVLSCTKGSFAGEGRHSILHAFLREVLTAAGANVAPGGCKCPPRCFRRGPSLRCRRTAQLLLQSVAALSRARVASEPHSFRAGLISEPNQSRSACTSSSSSSASRMAACTAHAVIKCQLNTHQMRVHMHKQRTRACVTVDRHSR